MQYIKVDPANNTIQEVEYKDVDIVRFLGNQVETLEFGDYILYTNEINNKNKPWLPKFLIKNKADVVIYIIVGQALIKSSAGDADLADFDAEYTIVFNQ